jgi:hypothetical protein
MVIAESFLREDAATEDRDNAFLHQLTHMTRDRGALTHDDRVNAVADAVAHFQRAKMMDVDQGAKAVRDEEMLAEIEDFLEGFNPADLSRHEGQWDPRGYVVIRARLEWTVKGH